LPIPVALPLYLRPIGRCLCASLNDHCRLDLFN
jgi:hypothetical protein